MADESEDLDQSTCRWVAGLLEHPAPGMRVVRRDIPGTATTFWFETGEWVVTISMAACNGSWSYELAVADQVDEGTVWIVVNDDLVRPLYTSARQLQNAGDHIVDARNRLRATMHAAAGRDGIE